MRSLTLVLVATSNFYTLAGERESERGRGRRISGKNRVVVVVEPAAVPPHLLRVVGEVNFVKDLGAVELDGVHLHRMWRQLPGLHPAQRQKTRLSLCKCRESSKVIRQREKTVN